MATSINRSKIAQSDKEIGILTSLLLKGRDVPGDLAEVGVYKGGTAWLINRLRPERTLHLFDTFEGFTELTEHDPNEWVNDPEFWKKDVELQNIYATLTEMFKGENVTLTKGSFPKSVGDTLEGKKFAFVHLDADAYEVTKKSLEYFYPKMSPGGLILLHDYNSSDMPVAMVVDEFMEDKPEPVVTCDTTQAFIIKQ